MSRIGNKPIAILDGVKVSVADRTVAVAGPKGSLTWTHRPEINVTVDDGARQVRVSRQDNQQFSRALHGLTRTLIANMIEGCATGFSKALELYGVGYGVQLKGDQFVMTCGRSHPVVLKVPPGLILEVAAAQARGANEPARFRISGADKQAVGEFAARVRRVRPPEPYKSKGVRYAGERIRRKVGKAFAGAGG